MKVTSGERVTALQGPTGLHGLAGARAPVLAAGCALSATLFFAAAPSFARAAFATPLQGDVVAALLLAEAAALYFGLTLARACVRHLAVPQALTLVGAVLGIAVMSLLSGNLAEGLAPPALAALPFASATAFGWFEAGLDAGKARGFLLRGVSRPGLQTAAAGLAACGLIETCFDPDEQAHLWIALYAALCVIFALAGALLWREARPAAAPAPGWGMTFAMAAALVLVPGVLALLAYEDIWL